MNHIPQKNINILLISLVFTVSIGLQKAYAVNQGDYVKDMSILVSNTKNEVSIYGNSNMQAKVTVSLTFIPSLPQKKGR